MLEEYVSVDLEMSGLNPREDRIIEIGAIKVKNGEIVDSLSTLINPHRELSPEIEQITGLTSADVEKGVEDYEGVRMFLDFAGNLPLIGHHIVSDYGFIKTCAVNHKWNLNNKVVDTLQVARKMLPSETPKNLQALCQVAGIEAGCHRALQDAIATHHLLQWLMSQPDSKEEYFVPKDLNYKVKKQGPITPAQKRQLTELLRYHGLELDIEIGSLTKNEASRKIDKIIFSYGRIPKA